MISWAASPPHATLSRTDALVLEQVIMLFEISPKFREQFERNSLQAIRDVAAVSKIRSLSPEGEHLLVGGTSSIYDLARLADGAWPGNRA